MIRLPRTRRRARRNLRRRKPRRRSARRSAGSARRRSARRTRAGAAVTAIMGGGGGTKTTPPSSLLENATERHRSCEASVDVCILLAALRATASRSRRQQCSGGSSSGAFRADHVELAASLRVENLTPLGAFADKNGACPLRRLCASRWDRDDADEGRETSDSWAKVTGSVAGVLARLIGVMGDDAATMPTGKTLFVRGATSLSLGPISGSPSDDPGRDALDESEIDVIVSDRAMAVGGAPRRRCFAARSWRLGGPSHAWEELWPDTTMMYSSIVSTPHPTPGRRRPGRRGVPSTAGLGASRRVARLVARGDAGVSRGASPLAERKKRSTTPSAGSVSASSSCFPQRRRRAAKEASSSEARARRVGRGRGDPVAPRGEQADARRRLEKDSRWTGRSATWSVGWSGRTARRASERAMARAAGRAALERRAASGGREETPGPTPRGRQARRQGEGRARREGARGGAEAHPRVPEEMEKRRRRRRRKAEGDAARAELRAAARRLERPPRSSRRRGTNSGARRRRGGGEGGEGVAPSRRRLEHLRGSRAVPPRRLRGDSGAGCSPASPTSAPSAAGSREETAGSRERRRRARTGPHRAGPHRPAGRRRRSHGRGFGVRRFGVRRFWSGGLVSDASVAPPPPPPGFRLGSSRVPPRGVRRRGARRRGGAQSVRPGRGGKKPAGEEAVRRDPGSRRARKRHGARKGRGGERVHREETIFIRSRI